MKSPFADYVKELNPDFQPPKRPFRRMDYKDAIEWLKANNVTKDDGTFYEHGEVSKTNKVQCCRNAIPLNSFKI